jgi:hypothetical protein
MILRIPVVSGSKIILKVRFQFVVLFSTLSQEDIREVSLFGFLSDIFLFGCSESIERCSTAILGGYVVE